MGYEDREELEERVELLEQQIEALTGSTAELGVLMTLGFGMTQRMAQVLLILVKRSPAVVSRNAFHAIFYGDRPDGGPEPNIFANYLSRLRKILKRLDCPGEIETVWNAGWKASPELVRWVKDLHKLHIPPQEK